MTSSVNDLTFGQKVIEFHHAIDPPDNLPGGVEWINNLDQEDTQKCIEAFYNAYFSDHHSRLFLFGINPGRHGAGLTGVGFTDPTYLEERCLIPNPFPKRHELSSHFIYQVIDAYGSVRDFYRNHYITALLPIGLLKDGKNYNYYDDRATVAALEPFIIECVDTQIGFGARKDRAICIGMGQNYRYFSELNQREKWFDKITPVPHPRWVMQYKLKDKHRYIDEYLRALNLD